jgi:pimeloyl-ACP methyl ester carboxylesterase
MFVRLTLNPLPRWTLALLLIPWGCGSNGTSETQDDAASDLEGSASKSAPGVFAEVNGTRLFYDVKGRGEPLVLISGASLDMRLWDDQFEVFAKNRQVIRYDPRGIGWSDVPEGPFSHYQDLYALLQFLGIQETDVLGFSFGGGVAIDFALTYPEVVGKLILIAPGLSSWKDEIAPTLNELSKVAEGEGTAKAIELILADPSMPTEGQEEARQKMSQMLSENVQLFDSNFAYVTLMEPGDPPANERLEEIGAPTLLVVGERDHAAIHENIDMLQQGIRGAKKVLIMGVGHMINLEKPNELNRVVLDFLNSH